MTTIVDINTKVDPSTYTTSISIAEKQFTHATIWQAKDEISDKQQYRINNSKMLFDKEYSLLYIERVLKF